MVAPSTRRGGLLCAWNCVCSLQVSQVFFSAFGAFTGLAVTTANVAPGGGDGSTSERSCSWPPPFSSPPSYAPTASCRSVCSRACCWSQCSGKRHRLCKNKRGGELLPQIRNPNLEIRNKFE